jgi:hypothetical protein
MLTDDEKRAIHRRLTRPEHGVPVTDARVARRRVVELLGEPERVAITAEWALMRAVDHFLAGRLSEVDLYECRVLAYYLLFGVGGQEWERLGVAVAQSWGEESRDALPRDEDADGE